MPKKPEQKKSINRAAGGDRAPVTNDSRFVSIHSDPRFAIPRRKDAKIAIDKRFTRMLKDDDFTQKAAVDRYGRKLAKNAGKEEIKRYYRIKDEDEDDQSGLEAKVRYDPARGEGVISSSEESSEESLEEDEVDQNEEEAIAREALQDVNNIPTGEVTPRLAAVNLDWDKVAAADLMAAFSSFAPTGGKVLRVTIYPSEFGRERMEKENMEGPPSDIFKSKEKEDIDPDEEVTAKTIIKEDRGQEFDSAKLRNYQLERLRYYYVVIETDKPSTAHHIYTQCDGTEYETTANFFDLRFIPDDTSFEDDTPRDQCTHIPENYKPNDFVTDALQHSKVKLTWDEDDAHRKIAAKRAFSQKEVEEMDVKAYLASDSDDEADEALSKEKYRTLLSGPLAGISKKSDGPIGDMEVTFTPGLSTKDKATKVIQEDETTETTVEKYARKEKERKQRRKEKARLSKAGISPEAVPDVEEAAPTPQDPAAVDLGFNDPFFASEPIPTNPKKEKRKKAKEQRAAETAEQASKRAELELLMADVDKDGLNHFDMKQVVKSEKSKKGKRIKKRSRQAEEALEEGTQRGFEIDIKDPRFAAIYENHEFAIDPTNPRFVKTKAMEKLLDERQRRTRNGGRSEEETVRKKVKVREHKKGDEVKRLVQSLKNKSNLTKL